MTFEANEPPQTGHLQSMPNVVGDSRPTEGFILDSEKFDKIWRLNNAYGVSARYLATGNGGKKVCLTIFPHAEIMLRHGRNFPEYQTSIARAAFLSEPEVLRRLQKAEEKNRTHYFPRMLTDVSGKDTNEPWYVLEFVEGTDITQIELNIAIGLKSEFMKAIELAHSVGVHFSDLREEDLRILPDGMVMIIDFNSSSYGKHISDDEAKRKDLEKLELIYTRMSSRKDK